ncbi:MAG: type II secretion system protein [Patescibacteria group bacterium]|nr:type II secretion system protein [Patescibacteria group bacterium]
MTAKPKGFSLIEVSMVLAISVVMMGVVAGVYNQRRNVANDDAAQQILSIVQTVQNEAKQGQGPSGANDIVAGETLWGNAVQFARSCPGNTTKSCFVIYKLVNTTTAIRSYDSYQIATPENFVFSYLAANTPDTVVVFRNSTGQAFVFSDSNPFSTTTTTDAENPAKYVAPGQALINTAQAPYDSAQAKYTLTVSTNDISITRQ